MIVIRRNESKMKKEINEHMIEEYVTKIIEKRNYIYRLIDQYIGEEISSSILEEQVVELYHLMAALEEIDPDNGTIFTRLIIMDLTAKVLLS